MAATVLDSHPMADDLSRILSADLEDDGDLVIEGTLRPRTLDEYIGQREVKANLSVLLTAARGRGEAADHVLLYGPPGLGKTTLATIIARELGVNVKYASGPAIERAGDLAAILTSLEERDVLFIDEIHRLNRAVEEILYPAMEDYALDVMIGKGPSARSLRLSLKPFTVVGATTRAGRISSPLRDRFGATYRLDFYTDDDLAAIVERSAVILGVGIDDAAIRAIARRGRGTPRIVNRLLKRVRDHAQVHGDGHVDESTATAAMRAMEIDDEGLDSTDRKLLAAIVQKFASGPVGVAALAAVLSEEQETIEDVYEPFLLRLGFIDRTPQGRIATDLARAHLSGLGYEIPPPRRIGARDARPVGPAGSRRPARDARGVIAPYVGRAARYEVTTPPPADGSTRARAGRLTLTHGVVETPQFMPVGTNATVKALSPDDIREVGASIILSNTYHLYLRPGHERIARLGGLHRFMGWDGPILTDSGGFQVVSLGDLRVVDEDGVTFRSHLDGSLHRFTPEVAIGVQEALGSDIAVAFDQPVYPSSPRAVVADATERTHRWAERSLAAHTRDRPGAVRDRPGRPGARPARRFHPVHRLAPVRRHLHRRAGRRRDARAARRDARCRDPAPGRRSAAALPDGPRFAGRPARGRPPRGRPVRFGAAGAGRAERPAVGPGRAAEHPQPALPRRSGADPGGLPVHRLPGLLARLSGPSVPGQGAARLPSRDLSQPDLHPRLHGQDPSCDPGWNLPCFDLRTAPSRGPGKWQ